MTTVHAAIDNERGACVRRAINDLIDFLEIPDLAALDRAIAALHIAIECTEATQQLLTATVEEDGR